MTALLLAEQLQIAWGIIGALLGVSSTLIGAFIMLGGGRYNTAAAAAPNGQNRKLDQLLRDVAHNRDVVMEGQREVVRSNQELRVIMERVAVILEHWLPRLSN